MTSLASWKKVTEISYIIYNWNDYTPALQLLLMTLTFNSPGFKVKWEFAFRILMGILFLSPEVEFGNIWFFPCLCVCMSVCGKKNINLGHSFWTIRDRGFRFSMHTQLIKSFQMVPRSLTLWPWPWPTFLKTITFLKITFEPLEEGLSYFTHTFLLMRHFSSYQSLT